MDSPRILSWEAAEARLTFVLAQFSFDLGTIDNARDLMSICRVQCAPPDVVSKGYWTTVSMSWPKLEIEIFPDRFEFYRFHDERTDIEEFYRQLGEPISMALIEQLPRAGI